MAEEAILSYLETNEEIPDSRKFAHDGNIDYTLIENAIKSLSGFRTIDANFFLAVPSDRSILMADLEKTVDPKVYNVGPIHASKNQWVKMLKEEVEDKDEGTAERKNEAKGKKKKTNIWVSRKVDQVDDKVQDLLKRIEAEEVVDGKDIDALKKRKLIALQTLRFYALRKGPEYVTKREKVATDLTREHIQSGDWKDLKFKAYNLTAQVQPIQIGYVHPLLEVAILMAHDEDGTARLTRGDGTVHSGLTASPISTSGLECGSDLAQRVREEIQNIFLQMGFEEMPTNNYVESSFWNFDALFQPQQHPARDSHDTFFLKVPSTTKELPEDCLERVKQVHESGGYGSKGYEYQWKRDEAEKNLLRTHTTAVSTRMLYKLAQQENFVPKRYFSIDRVFRNEAVDRTHLAEFHQIEGLVCDRGLTLGDLIGLLEDFFSRLGMSELRFKPAYNPYTEPSMEIFSYHKGLEKWVEIGNSGMFRPEMLLPMGLPEDVNVIAWGLSLERPTMILYGYDNIRDLFGHKVEFKLIKNSPICRLGLQ